MTDAVPRTAPAPTPWQRGGIHLAIVVVVGLQAAAGLKLLCPPKAFPALAPLRVCCPPALWPFTDYPMYQASYEPGTRASHYRLFAELADGRRVELDAERFGQTPRRFRHEVIDRLLWGQRGPIQSFARTVGEQLGPPRRLIVEDHPVRLDAGGLVPLPAEPVLEVAFDDRGRLR